MLKIRYMLKAIVNATVFTGSEVLRNSSILIKDGKVVEVGAAVPEGAEMINAEGKNIAAAFVDIQPNGGYDLYFSKELSEASLQDMYQASIDHGTGYILPTLISSDFETILKGIEVVKSFMQRQPGVLGMHLEGPFINVNKRGAHPPAIIRKPADEELKQIIAAGKDVIKIMTIAPECFTDDQLQLLLDSGINIAIGHTAVTYEQAQYYFSKGITLVTHLYNAMNQMGHRECGLVGAIFDNENVYAPIILDGGHCHYAAARVAYKQKGNKLILLSDAAFLGRKKQVFDWENLSIKMVDGYYRDGAGNLGGAAISMIDAVKNARIHLKVSLQEAIEMATSRVARAIKVDGRIGFIQPGYAARFVLFDDELDSVVFLAG